MRKSSRVAAIGALVVLVGTAVGGSATAQEADADATGGAFSATASASALTIDLFGNVITMGAVTAEVAPDLAKGTVTETILGPVTGIEPAVAQQPGGEPEAKTTLCDGQQLTELPGVVRFDVMCGVATARAATNDLAGHGLGGQIVVEPSVSEVLETLQIQDPAAEGANALLDGLNENLVQPLTESPLGEIVEPAAITVQEVLNDVLQLQSTARIVIAPSIADATATECDVVATAHAQAVRVELLPVGAGATGGLLPEDLEAGEPLATLTISENVAKDTASRCGGESTEEETAALVCIELGSTELGTALGLPEGRQCVEGGQQICVLEDTPLESCISLSAAGTDAGADAASIQVFKGVNGGVDIATGRAATSTQAAAPEAPQAAAPAGELPRTGGPALLPVLGGGLLAAAAVARRFAGKA